MDISFISKTFLSGLVAALSICADEPIKLSVEGQSPDSLAVGVQGAPGLHRLQTASAVAGADWSVNGPLTSGTNFVVAKNDKTKFIRAQAAPPNDVNIFTNALSLVDRGREAFRHDTFGSESFWGRLVETAPGHCGNEQRRRWARRIAQNRACCRPQGRLGSVARIGQASSRTRRGKSRRSRDHAHSPAIGLRRGRERIF